MTPTVERKKRRAFSETATILQSHLLPQVMCYDETEHWEWGQNKTYGLREINNLSSKSIKRRHVIFYMSKYSSFLSCYYIYMTLVFQTRTWRKSFELDSLRWRSHFDTFLISVACGRKCAWYALRWKSIHPEQYEKHEPYTVKTLSKMFAEFCF